MTLEQFNDQYKDKLYEVCKSYGLHNQLDFDFERIVLRAYKDYQKHESQQTLVHSWNTTTFFS